MRDHDSEATSRPRIRVVPLILWLLFSGVVIGIVVVNLEHDTEQRIATAGPVALAHMALDPDIGYRASRQLAKLQWLTPATDIDAVRPVFINALRSDDLALRRRAVAVVGDLAESYLYLRGRSTVEHLQNRPFAFADLLPYLTPAVTIGSIESRIEAAYALVDIGRATRQSGASDVLISTTLRCLAADPHKQLATEASRALLMLEQPAARPGRSWF